ncbi:hypothetical protein D3C76_948920 [compost metagenome]
MANIGIVELITQIGNDNIELQPLDVAITDMQKKKGHNLYTFGSAMSFDLSGTKKFGLVVWLDRDRVKEITEK